MRPFWRMLVAIDSGRSPHLSCDESFAILEFLADEALNGADPQMLHNAIRRHLARCPGCWSYYLERLKVMESELAARSQHGQIS